MPLVSIIVPCFKVEKYLDRCINSLINQTLSDIEILLIDDCSPDKVPQICDNWAKCNPRIKVIHKENNEGLGFARNTGLELATGEYIAFVDSDDYVSTQMYERLYHTATETNSDIVYCGLNQEYKINSFKEIRDFARQTSFTKNQLNNLSIQYFNSPTGKNLFMSVWHSIYKRETIGNLRFYSERLICSEDLPFQIAILRKANKVTYIPDTLYYYCLNENSLSNKFKFEKCFQYFTLTNIIRKYYTHEEEKHIWCFFFNSCQHFIRSLIKSNISTKNKIRWLNELCKNKEIISFLEKYPNISKNNSLFHLSKQYYYCIINGHVLLLYFTAIIDYHIICNKLGIKSNK